MSFPFTAGASCIPSPSSARSTTIGEVCYGEGDLAYDKVRTDGDIMLKRLVKEHDEQMHRIHRLVEKKTGLIAVVI